jgi:hypothetical protein
VEPDESSAPEPADGPDPLERLAAVVREDPLLWPVAAVTALVVCTFGAAILIYALRLRSLISGVVLLFLIFVTVWGLDADIRERRLRPRSRLVLGLWLGSGLFAVGLDWLGAL